MIEDAIQAAVRAAVAELVTEMRQLRAEVAQLRSMREPLPTVPEAAELLGVSESTIWRGIRAGSIPVRRIGRSVREEARQIGGDYGAAEP
jgi:excisionase family DNA binding protein